MLLLCVFSVVLSFKDLHILLCKLLVGNFLCCLDNFFTGFRILQKMNKGRSPMVMLSLNANARAVNGRGLISGGGAKMSWPLSSLHFASESCFFNIASASLSSVPLSSRCFATSGSEVGFFGETASSSPNEIWLMLATACCGT
nr:DNA replication licensing factor MCM2 [Ipomoea batatas]